MRRRGYGDGVYFDTRRVSYGDEQMGWATFVPVCHKCGRFVQADAMMKFKNETIAPGPNATCSKCGRTEMLFEGFL
jgi:hypothetical protein